MFKKTAMAFLVGAVSLTPFVSQAAQKKLIFATEATYPPFVYMNANGTMNGFDADIIEALCNQMHRQCKLVNAPWDSLIPSLQIGRFDALFGGMGITAQREKVVQFTKPYYENAVTFVVKKGDNFTLENIKGKTIGVQVGTTFDRYLRQKYGNLITIKTYESNMTALMDLKAGRINAVFLDKPVATMWLKQKINEDYTDKYNIYNKKYFGIGNGIAIKKTNPELVKELNTALTQIKQDGTYQKIVNQWFGKS